MLEDAQGDPEEEITDTPATLEFIASTMFTSLDFTSSSALTFLIAYPILALFF